MWGNLFNLGRLGVHNIRTHAHKSRPVFHSSRAGTSVGVGWVKAFKSRNGDIFTVQK